MHYLVTGGAGFIGSHLVEDLVSKGHEVTVLDDFSNGSRANLHDILNKIEIVHAGVEHADLIEFLSDCKKPDGIFHLATHPRSFSLQKPKKDIETNCKGMIAVLELARKHNAKVVFTSNSGIYGSMAGDEPINERCGNFPSTPYDANKLVSEYYCKIYHAIHNVRSCIVRFATVYGERQVINEKLNWRPLVATLLKNVLQHKQVRINGDGKQTRDLIYVKDAVQGLVKAMDSQIENADIHLISTNTETSVNEVLQVIELLTGEQPKVEYTAPLAGDIRRMRYDYSKAKQALGFEPQYPLHDGIKRMIPYILAH